MALSGVGVGIVDVPRLAALLSRYGGKVEARLFTDDERAYCRPRRKAAQHFAARLAAKQALWRALGAAGPYLEVEVTGGGGAPKLLLRARAARTASDLGIKGFHVSLSHSGDTAMATVLLER